MCFQEGFQCSQGGAALQKELFEELQSPGEELLKQMSRKGEGVIKKEHVGSGEAERSWQEWRTGFLDVFKGVKKGSLRDSNADSKSPPRICDYYIVIKKIPNKI